MPTFPRRKSHRGSGRAIATYGSGEFGGLPDLKKALKINMHPDKRPYRCSWCGWVPRQEGLLVDHGGQWFCRSTKACEERGLFEEDDE